MNSQKRFAKFVAKIFTKNVCLLSQQLLRHNDSKGTIRRKKVLGVVYMNLRVIFRKVENRGNQM